MADGVAPGRRRRARLRLQMEHGLDARHAELHRARNRCTANTITATSSFGLHLRLLRELHPAAVARRSGARQRLAFSARMPGDRWQRFANLRAYYTLHVRAIPARSFCSWAANSGRSRSGTTTTAWTGICCDSAEHAGVQQLVRDLNRLYRTTPALHELDCEADGFTWLVADDTEHSVFAWLRNGTRWRRALPCGAQFHARRCGSDYRINVPSAGQWREIFNSDSSDLWWNQCRQRRHCRGAADRHRRRAHADVAAARRPHPCSGGLSMRVLEGSPHRLGRDLGRPRHELRAVFCQCREGRAVPVRSAGPPRARTHCAA